MLEKNLCRRCVQAALGKHAFRLRQPFAIAGSAPHYAPDLPFKTEHIRIELSIDPRGKSFSGEVTHRVRAVSPGQKQIRLDQIGLEIESASASVGGKGVPFDIDGHALKLALPRAPKVGEVFEFTVRYRGFDPKRGLYFTGPDRDYPKKRYQTWSQGQDEDSRYWFPTFDYPNQKATSELIASVPQGFTAVSNGALLSRKDLGQKGRGKRTVFHYRLGVPHVTYLITLAVGEFSAWEDRGPQGLPVQYFVEPGREADGKRAFSNTPKMIEAYARRIGVPYAYEKYSQVAVQDFIFGGMENTSATTQTDLTLHDEKAHVDFSSDPLVAHELAHQWFGDLLTCRDWSHGWLNEGFATFMERVWIEENPGKDGGFDEAKYYSYADLKEYMDEDRRRYRRPIVCNTYVEPIDLFDTHLYQKGGLVLNLIRHLLGEDLFWLTIKNYVSRHREQSVETIDLIRAIEDTTGRNLRRVFDEWVYGAGYPEFEVAYAYHDEKKQAELVIEQKQTGGQPSVTKDGATTPLFHLPVVIELTLEGGKKVTHTIEVSEARERVFVPVSGKPLMVRFDPDAWIPKTLKFPRPKEMLLYQLATDSDCMGRIEAAHELVKHADAAVVAALGKALRMDKFWGVQVEVADALAAIRTDGARDALLAALGVRNAKARRGVVRALGTFRDPLVTTALRKLAERDESYFVEAQAISAWTHSQLGATGGLPEAQAEARSEARIEAMEKFLLAQLKRESYREIVRGAVLRSLVELPGIESDARPRAVQTLLDWSARGKPMDARTAAIDALGRLARKAAPSLRIRVMEALGRLADEDNFRIRMMLVHALSETESPHAIGLLSRIHETDVDGRVKRHAHMAMSYLETAGSTPESVTALKAQLEKLEEEQRKLRTMLEDKAALKKTELKKTSPGKASRV